MVGKQTGTDNCSHDLQSRTEHDQGCYPGSPLQDEVCVCPLPHQLCYSGEWFSCWDAILGMKNTSIGFGWGQGLLVQYLKSRKMSWFLEEMSLNLCQIQVLWISKPPPKVKNNDFRKFWMASMFLKKELFSRLTNKIWVVQLQKQQDARWFYGLHCGILKRQ